MWLDQPNWCLHALPAPMVVTLCTVKCQRILNHAWFTLRTSHTSLGPYRRIYHTFCLRWKYKDIYMYLHEEVKSEQFPVRLLSWAASALTTELQIPDNHQLSQFCIGIAQVLQSHNLQQLIKLCWRSTRKFPPSTLLYNEFWLAA